MNFDGCWSEDGMIRGRIGAATFNNLAQLQAFTTETGAMQVSLDIFVSPVAHPEDPFPARAIPDLRVAEGSAAEDVAVTLPGVNDSFLGAGPDLGAYEAGADLPVYGPRRALPGVSVGDARVVEGDDGTVALEFTVTLQE
jgi:hypothetical protein